MFADIAKIALKASLVAVIVAAIIALVTYIAFPMYDEQFVREAIGHGKAILEYYIPTYAPLLTLGFAVISLKFAIIPFLRMTLMTFRWLFIINE